MSALGGLLIVLVLIGANAFFVAAEFALLAVDRNRVSQRAEEGSRRAQVTAGVLGRLSHHLSGAQLGITISSLVLGFVAEPTLARLIDPALESVFGDTTVGVSIFLALAIATVAQMVLGELIPKGLAIARPLRASLMLSRPMKIYSMVFGPVIAVLNGAANWTVRRFGIEPKEELSSVRSLGEFEILFQVSAEEGTLDQKATQLLTRSIRFGEKTAADILIPRTDLVAVGCDDTAGDLVEVSRRSGFSRFPVVGDDLDDLRGVVYVKAVHTVPVTERSSTPVRELMVEAVVVPETRNLESLLVDIQRTRSHLVVIVDEYGGTAGIVTLEDLLEEIVGDIADEYDPPETRFTQAAQSGEWVLSGSLHPDEVFDVCGLVIPDGDYETVAGFVLDRLGRIPDGPGESFEHEGWVITVEQLEKLRVSTVRVTQTDGASPQQSPADGQGGGS